MKCSTSRKSAPIVEYGIWLLHVGLIKEVKEFQPISKHLRRMHLSQLFLLICEEKAGHCRNSIDVAHADALLTKAFEDEKAAARARAKPEPRMPSSAEINSQVIDDLFQAVNFVGNDQALIKALSERIRNEHRTLVQNFFRVMAKVVEDYAQTGIADLRNQGSLDWAKKVAQIESYMSFI